VGCEALGCWVCNCGKSFYLVSLACLFVLSECFVVFGGYKWVDLYVSSGMDMVVNTRERICFAVKDVK
jgi:hypothetical protein